MAQCMTNQNRENEQDTRATADDVGLQQCHVSLTAASVTACLQHTRVHTAALYQATAHTSAIQLPWKLPCVNDLILMADPDGRKIISDIAVFVLKRDVKLQLTN